MKKNIVIFNKEEESKGENSPLRKISEKIEKIDDNVLSLIKDLIDTLKETDNGVALSSPQIGVNKRIFVVSPIVFEADNEVDNDGEIIDENNDDQNTDNKSKVAPNKKYKDEEFMVFINPEINKTSRKQTLMEEGCLSIPGIIGKVKRYEKTTITAMDETGKKKIFGASGLLAQVFQHEIDHLDGVLFIDRTNLFI